MMHMWPLLSAALLSGDLPLATRQAKLAPYFQPAPGSEVVLDEGELRDFGKKRGAGLLRGFVRVTPPRGTCFTLTRDPSNPDDTICKATTLAFTLKDLDKFGRLAWRVGTGEGDFGTDLFWRSRYRVAVTTPAGTPPEDPPVYEFVTNCRAERQGFGGRRLYLDLVGGKTFVVALPDQDKLIPQPDADPNLFIVGNVTGKVSVKEASAGKPPPPPPADGAAPPPKPVEKVEVTDGRDVWHLPVRGTYEMSSTNFMPHGSVAPGGKGLCRYNYAGPEEDPKTGRIECRDADGYDHVLLPATCLSDLK
jgi:hypothetical protein